MAVSEEIQEKVLEEATSVTPDFSTDYTDERFAQNDQRTEQLRTELEHTYGGMIESTDKFYKDLKDSLQNQADTQAKIQQDNTDFAIDLIEQQKEQANKDYIKEQSGAYVDWQKQSNQYGVEAEKMASAGLNNSGYSESSQVSMYNTYQNRVATARESLQRIIQEYNNNINQAILQNNSALAQIYADLSVQQTQLALEGFQYQNQLMDTLVDRRMQLDSDHWQREYAIMQQQNWEKQMAEEYRQFEEGQKFTAEQNALDRELQKELKAIEHEYDKILAEIEQQYKLDYLAAQTKAEKEVLDKEYALKKQQALDDLENAKKLATHEHALKNGGNSTTGAKGVTAIKNASTKTSGKQGVAISGKNAIANAVQSNSFTGTTYKEAINYMTKNGVPSSVASGIYTASEFSQRRSSYSITGQGSAAVRLCSSYPEYLSYIVKYNIEQNKK